jgi:hypothetical protein
MISTLSLSRQSVGVEWKHYPIPLQYLHSYLVAPYEVDQMLLNWLTLLYLGGKGCQKFHQVQVQVAFAFGLENPYHQMSVETELEQ